MPKRITPLSEVKIRTAKPGKNPYKFFDGGGLFLLVTPSGGKLWNFKYRFDIQNSQFQIQIVSGADRDRPLNSG